MFATAALTLLLQVATPSASAPATAPAGDTLRGNYATAALARFIDRAAERNRYAPRDLRGYRAAVTSEIGVLTRREDGTEAVASVEQMASTARWTRPGTLDQRVIGYRAQSIGPGLSALSFVERPWIVPTLYGNRIALFFGQDTSELGVARRERARRQRAASNEEPVLAVHPLAEDRDRVYRFTGGDTVATIRVQGRVLPIVRVRVEPQRDLTGRVFVFRGEIDVDAARHQIVRMRGQFLVVNEEVSILGRIRRAIAEPLAFVELENQELEERYWLPASQRVELQVATPTAGDGRAVIRVTSRFRDYALDIDRTLAVSEPGAADSLAAPDAAAVAAALADTLIPPRVSLRLAPRDTLDAYRDWELPIGAATAAVSSDDFDDVAPDRLRPTGAPRWDVAVERASDLIRFNRIEGLFTGAGVTYRLRDRFPGLTLAANGGWAWSERTPRGRIQATLERGPWTHVALAGRRLDLTNDFRVAFDSGSSVAALFFTSDDYDYVDRRLATVQTRRRFGLGRRWEARLLGGLVADRAARAALDYGIFRGDSAFRPNRGVDEGDYGQVVAELLLNPNAAAEFLRPGLGAVLRWEVGRGGLDYSRTDVRVTARRYAGDWTFAARGDAGAVFGATLPAQQLFELGGSARLSGYDYKEFVGDRAAIVAGEAMWTSPFLRAPIVVSLPFVRRLVLPGASPALSVGAQSGWTSLTSAGGRAAALRLGTRVDPMLGTVVPVSRETDGVRTTVEARLRFFGGAIGVGVARAVDRGAPWRFVGGAGVVW